MKAILAARIDESVSHQRLEEIEPACALAAGSQQRRPEAVEIQQIPQVQRKPASAPLARSTQLQPVKPHPDHRILCGRDVSMIMREERHLTLLSSALVHLDGANPSGVLRVV